MVRARLEINDPRRRITLPLLTRGHGCLRCDIGVLVEALPLGSAWAETSRVGMEPAAVAVRVGVAVAMGVILCVEAPLLSEAPQVCQYFFGRFLGG